MAEHFKGKYGEKLEKQLSSPRLHEDTVVNESK